MKPLFLLLRLLTTSHPDNKDSIFRPNSIYKSLVNWDMPLYTVSHAAPLSLDQKEALAEAITHLHSDRFQTPRWYINVIFTDASAQTVFVGGRRRLVNHITARVRSGPTRSRESFNELCSDINSAWHHIVHPELSPSELPSRELELAAIFITSELLAGMKVGFPVPAAGTELAWAKEHFESFKERAALGDEDFVDYVEELEKKPEFNETPRSE